jgi:4-aminobutyrate--pyruvate transaminase
LLETAKSLEKHAIVGEVRGRGMWIGIDCTTDKKTRAMFPMDRLVRLIQRAQSKGVIIKLMGQALELAPPLVITRDDINKGIEILNECFADEVKELPLG